MPFLLPPQMSPLPVLYSRQVSTLLYVGIILMILHCCLAIDASYSSFLGLNIHLMAAQCAVPFNECSYPLLQDMSLPSLLERTVSPKMEYQQASTANRFKLILFSEKGRHTSQWCSPGCPSLSLNTLPQQLAVKNQTKLTAKQGGSVLLNTVLKGYWTDTN